MGLGEQCLFVQLILSNSILDISILLVNSIDVLGTDFGSHSKGLNIDKISISIRIGRYRDDKVAFGEAGSNLRGFWCGFWEESWRKLMTKV